MTLHVSLLCTLFFGVLPWAFIADPDGDAQYSFVRTAQKSAESTIAIELFGCIMPLPSGYVLRGDLRSSGKFYFARRDGGGFLRVGPIKSLQSENYDVIAEKPLGALTIVRIQGTKEYAIRPPTMTIVHDGQTAIWIGGPDEAWVEVMARACVANPLP